MSVLVDKGCGSIDTVSIKRDFFLDQLFAFGSTGKLSEMVFKFLSLVGTTVFFKYVLIGSGFISNAWRTISNACCLSLENRYRYSHFSKLFQWPFIFRIYHCFGLGQADNPFNSWDPTEFFWKQSKLVEKPWWKDVFTFYHHINNLIGTKQGFESVVTLTFRQAVKDQFVHRRRKGQPRDFCTDQCRIDEDQNQ